MTELVGGQALIGGVMMRQGEWWAAAARDPQGNIVTVVEGMRFAFPKLRGIPIARGVGALIDSLRTGMRSMRWSRRVSEGVEEPSNWAQSAVVIATVAAVCSAFLLVPIWVAEAVTDGLAVAAVEGCVRLAMFIAYLAMISRLPGIRHTLALHGAEHMTVSAYEHGVPLTPVEVRAFSVRHPRCGTDFLLLIFVLSILVFALVGTQPPEILVLSRLVLAPVVVGLAYEIVRLGGDRAGWHRALAVPGLWMQRFTTRDPSDDDVEVAIAAIHALFGAKEFTYHSTLEQSAT